MILKRADLLRLAILGLCLAVSLALSVVNSMDPAVLGVGLVFVLLIAVARLSHVHPRADTAAVGAAALAFGVLELGGAGGGATVWLAETLCMMCVGAAVRTVDQSIEGNETFHRRTESLIDELTIHDEVSGLLKRRYGELAIEEEIRRARRTGTPTTLVLAAPDPLHDYPVGDLPDDDREAAIMGDVLRDVLRVTDRLARLNSTTFAAILPATDADGGAVVAEKIRQVAEERGARALRYGVASYPASATSAADLLEEALAALNVARTSDLLVASPSMLA